MSRAIYPRGVTFLKSFILVMLQLLSSAHENSDKLDLANWQLCQTAMSNCEDWEIGKDITHKGWAEAIYKHTFPTPEFCIHYGCWLFLGELADSGSIYINGQKIAEFTDSCGLPYYVRHESQLIPIGQLQTGENNEIEIRTKDLNQTISGLRNTHPFISNYSIALKHSRFDLIQRTILTLASSWILIILFFVLTIFMMIVRRKEVAGLLTYSLASSFYLFSFSEYPREFLSPLLSSGPLHFALRLFQDLALILLSYAYADNWPKKKWIMIICSIYLTAISSQFLFWDLGITTYHFYFTLLQVISPLVLFPMIFSILLIKKLKDTFERRYLAFLFSILTVLQINDLFAFWQVYRGFFFVRFYPIVIVVSFICLFFRRLISESHILRFNAYLGELIARVAHDIRSPVSALQIGIASFPQERDETKLIKQATQRIKNIADDLLQVRRSGMSKDRCKWIMVNGISQIIEDLFVEKRLNYPKHVFILKQEAHGSVNHKLFLDPEGLQRILSNLINNGVESYGKESGTIVVSLFVNKRYGTIQVKDFGAGIDSATLDALELGPVTNKKHGFGIGLWTSKQQVREWNGQFVIHSNRGKGTTINMILSAQQVS